jgi:hypothetical protein
MTTSYPIVAQYELDDPAKRGPLNIIKRRDKSEIPKIKPHELLVWRVGNRYIVDERQLHASDDTVVRASSVSVVSVRPSTEVGVSFQVDSGDAGEFTVRVTFICSVLDPVMVVRDGQVDAADALLAYLRGYQDLFEVGLNHPVSEINKVRTKLAAHVRSYMALRPPKISGIEVASAITQVETPDALGKIREVNDQTQIDLAQKKGEALIAAASQAERLSQQAEVTKAVGDSPIAALGLAYVDGTLTSREWAEQAQQMGDAQELKDLAAQNRQYAIEDRDSQWTHDREQADIEWRHSQVEIQRKDDRENRKDQLEANIELLKMLAEAGHLDTYNADLEDLIRRVRGDQPAAAVASGDRPAELTGGDAHGLGNWEDGNDN